MQHNVRRQSRTRRRWEVRPSQDNEGVDVMRKGKGERSRRSNPNGISMKEKRLELVLHLSKSITDTPLEATCSKKDEGLGRAEGGRLVLDWIEWLVGWFVRRRGG